VVPYHLFSGITPIRKHKIWDILDIILAILIYRLDFL